MQPPERLVSSRNDCPFLNPGNGGGVCRLGRYIHLILLFGIWLFTLRDQMLRFGIRFYSSGSDCLLFGIGILLFGIGILLRDRQQSAPHCAYCLAPPPWGAAPPCLGLGGLGGESPPSFACMLAYPRVYMSSQRSNISNF